LESRIFKKLAKLTQTLKHLFYQERQDLKKSPKIPWVSLKNRSIKNFKKWIKN